MSYFNTRKQKILEYRSRLQKKHNGCPWPAYVLTIIKLAKSTNHKDQKILESIKKMKRFNDDDIFELLNSFENSDWNNEKIKNKFLKDKE